MPTTRIRARRTTEEVEVEIESEPGKPARIPSNVYKIIGSLPAPLSLPELLDAIDLLVDQRVASVLDESHLDNLLGYTDQLREQGADPVVIEDYVKDRAYSLWDKQNAKQVHKLTAQLR